MLVYKSSSQMLVKPTRPASTSQETEDYTDIMLSVAFKGAFHFKIKFLKINFSM